MNKSRRKLKGFTLLELIIVIAILAVLSAILIPSISDYIRTNHIQSANSQAQQVYMAAQDYLVSEQVKGVRASDIMDGTPKLCWILVQLSRATTAETTTRTKLPWLILTESRAITFRQRLTQKPSILLLMVLSQDLNQASKVLGQLLSIPTLSQ